MGRGLATGISGLDLTWGVVPLVAGVVVLASAFEGATGRIGFSELHLLAAVGAAGSVLAALGVWARLRELVSGMDEFAELAGTSLDDVAAFAEFGAELLAVLQPHPGAGLWLVLVAGLLSVGCSVRLLTR